MAQPSKALVCKTAPVLYLYQDAAPSILTAWQCVEEMTFLERYQLNHRPPSPHSSIRHIQLLTCNHLVILQDSAERRAAQKALNLAAAYDSVLPRSATAWFSKARRFDWQMDSDDWQQPRRFRPGWVLGRVVCCTQACCSRHLCDCISCPLACIPIWPCN